MEANAQMLKSLESEIKAAMEMPDVDPVFLAHLRQQVTTKHGSIQPQLNPHRHNGLHPVWAIVIAVIAMLGIMILVVGPQDVYAAVTRWLGYIPGVGIVNRSESIRVLAEQVAVTREGITVTINSVTLSVDNTQVDYEMTGVPRSAYPDQENIHGCWSEPYLRLPDGTELTTTNFGYEPVPSNVNEAVFVLPCIPNTLPGTVPVNWEFPLIFIPAPEDLNVMSVIELTPSLPAAITTESMSPSEGDLTPVAPVQGTVTVHKEITTQDGYILIGQFQPEDLNGRIDPRNLGWIMTGALEITDANGLSITYTFPQDMITEINQEPSGMGWAAEFNADELVYPLTLSYSGVEILMAESGDVAEFTVDVGPNPQPGQEWELNLALNLSGHVLTLNSLRADSHGGYTFGFSSSDIEIYQANVQIVGEVPNGGGGGGGGGLTGGTFQVSLSYETLPAGELTLQVSNLMLIGDPVVWQGQWSPATP